MEWSGWMGEKRRDRLPLAQFCKWGIMAAVVYKAAKDLKIGTREYLHPTNPGKENEGRWITEVTGGGPS